MKTSKNFALFGHIIHTDASGKLSVSESSWLVCREGKSGGIFKALPEAFGEFPKLTFEDKLIIPGMVDLHLHAPQFAFRGLGMDWELLDWLNNQAFPEEAKYADPDYADKAYGIFADAMKKSATTRACVFASRHSEATLLLMDKLEQSGIVSYVGKVNMDREAPDGLREASAEESLRDTRSWLQAAKGRYSRTMPILTPRFIPSCSDELMEGLGQLQREYGLPVQSHLSENPGEIEWVKALRPDSRFYGDAYHIHGLFGGSGCKTLMAHCVWSGPEEIALMKERGVFIAHCPASNLNVASGIAPMRKYMDMGMKLGLGSDVAGGQTESMFRAISDAIQCSKMYWRYMDQSCKALSFEEAFSLATRRGGEFFGRVGAFDPGFELDALVLDDSSLPHPQPLSPAQRLERAVYLGLDKAGIEAKFVAGEQII